MSDTPTPSQALERAIECANGITALARALPVKSHTVIQQWRANRVPAEYCPRIERITGVPCELLRPDVEWSVLRSKVGPHGAEPVSPSA
jgi:DNA-binding transcriptional regulator YdaS (Cro superfamily)